MGKLRQRAVEKLAQGLIAKRVDRWPACSLLLCSALSPVFPTLPHPLCEVGVGGFEPRSADCQA